MKRKKEIISLVEIYYKEYEVLRNLSPEIFQKAVLDMFLDTNLTIEEIEEKLKEMVKRKGGKVLVKYKEDGKSYLEVTTSEKIYLFVVLTSLIISLITISILLIR